jgi:heme exporter protein A
VSLPALRLVARDLACIRGGRPVFEGVSFTIERGGALAITGPNGAGKSSLLRVLAGLVSPAHGSLRLEGADEDVPLAEHLHYAGHADALKPALTVEENLAFWAAYYGDAWLDEREALALLSIGHLAALPAAYLSAGQRRRLTLARLLVSRRPVWLLDEPTSALDAAGQADVARLIARHRDAGGMVIAATHADLGMADQQAIELGA